MSSLAWIAIALVGLWIVAKLVFKVVGGVVHILLLLAVVVFIASYFM